MMHDVPSNDVPSSYFGLAHKSLQLSYANRCGTQASKIARAMVKNYGMSDKVGMMMVKSVGAHILSLLHRVGFFVPFFCKP